jgi:hypothetical protein
MWISKWGFSWCLESILYIILYICTFIHSPGLPLSRHNSPPICISFCNADIREIGYRKLGHLENYEAQILPYFTPYWCDFVPFVKDLIIACFPVKACLPNDFQYDQALQILKMAWDSVEEPQIVLPLRAKRASTSFYLLWSVSVSRVVHMFSLFLFLFLFRSIADTCTIRMDYWFIDSC